jgi:hypothetical protein
MLDGFQIAFQYAIGFCLVGLVTCVPFLYILRWWSEGTVGALEGGGLIAMYVVLLALLLGPVPTPARVMVFILMAGATLGLVLIPLGVSKAGARSLDSEQEATYRSAIAAHPGNVAARCELANNLYRRGRVSEAIDELEQAVQLSPKTTQTEQITLKRWIEEYQAKPQALVICPFCREDTPAGQSVCQHCGRPLSAMRELADVVKADISGMARFVLIGCLALIPLGFVLSILQPVFATILMTIIVVAGLWWLRSRFS